MEFFFQSFLFILTFSWDPSKEQLLKELYHYKVLRVLF